MSIGTYTGKRLLQLHDKRWADLGNWRNRWEEISYYILPQQRSFTSEQSRGDRRGENRIFDSTAIAACERLATRLHEAMTNPASPWFNLEFSDDTLNDSVEAREWLDACEDAMREAINASNFDTVIGQFYLDLCALGSACISVEQKTGVLPWNGLVFHQVHFGKAGFAEDANHVVDWISQEMKLTTEQIMQRFPDTAPQHVQEAFTNGEYDKEHAVVLCRFTRANAKESIEQQQLPEERKYAEMWVDRKGAAVIEDGGAYERSAYVARWRLKSDDFLGYGPGERAFPTVHTINEAERLELSSWEKMIDPPIKTTSNNVVGDLNIKARGVTVVRKLDEIDQWDLRPDLNHHLIQLEDKRFQVREIFHYHALELPPREQVGQMTAFEVAKRTEQVYRAIGTTAIQLQSDALDPMIRRIFGIMHRAGQLPPMPESIQTGGNINVTYVGPLMLASKASELEAIDRFLADTMMLAKLEAEAAGSSALDIIDLDATQRRKAERLGVPATLLRSEDEVEEIRAERSAKAAAVQQAEVEKTNSETLKNTGDAIGQENLNAQMAESGMKVVPGPGLRR